MANSVCHGRTDAGVWQAVQRTERREVIYGVLGPVLIAMGLVLDAIGAFLVASVLVVSNTEAADRTEISCQRG